MFKRLVAISLGMTATVAVVLSVAILISGCGPGTHEVDKVAEYSAESIAGELVFRYQALVPDARKSTRIAKPRSKGKTIAELEGGEKVLKKAAGGAVTKKRTGPPTIDDVLDDIDDKISRLKGTSRSEARQKMIDVISKDNSLAEADKRALTELLGKLEE